VVDSADFFLIGN